MRSASSRISTVSSRSASADAAFQQLRGAADAGERVLHLMRQDRRHAADAAGGAAEGRSAGRARGRPRRPAASAARSRAPPAAAVRLHGDARLVQARAFERQVVVGDRDARRARTWSISRKSGLSARHQVGQRAAARAAAATGRGTARRPGWRSGTGRRASSSTHRHRQRAQHGGGIAAAAARGAGRMRAQRAALMPRAPPVTRLGSAAVAPRCDQRVVEAVDQRLDRRRVGQAVDARRGTRPSRAGRASTRRRACARAARPARAPKWASMAR